MGNPTALAGTSNGEALRGVTAVKTPTIPDDPVEGSSASENVVELGENFFNVSPSFSELGPPRTSWQQDD